MAKQILIVGVTDDPHVRLSGDKGIDLSCEGLVPCPRQVIGPVHAFGELEDVPSSQWEPDRRCCKSCHGCVVRGSAFYSWAFVGTAIRHKTWFSVTARMTKTVTAAIASIQDTAWHTIKYPNAIWEADDTVPGGGYWVIDAEVAEVPFVAFTGRRKAEHVSCRLVVRRVKRHQPLASDGTEQSELFATYRHHAFITNSTLTTIEADQRHRDHAIVEQVIAELKDNALAHLPSGRYAANAAWVACAVIAFNIARATAVAANLAKARWATVRTKIIKVPGRIATTSRRLDLHLPAH